MAQLERTTKRYSESSIMPSKAQTSPTFEQLLRVEETHWSISSSPGYGMNHDQEEYFSPTHNKKSVLTKVKEKAKKLKHTLSGRKKPENELSDDNHSTPSWGVSLDDDEDDDLDEEHFDAPEYLGAPMYESEAAPENLKETSRQHPRAVPVVSEKHMMPSRNVKHEDNDKSVSPNTTMTEAVSEKLAPAYAVVSDATHRIASKIAGLTITTPDQAQEKEVVATPRSPGYEAKTMNENSRNLKQSPQTWDKGVSVKEYFMNKLEPGDDERALSQAITDAISPRKTTVSDTGVVEKVKEAVTSFFWHEDPSNPKAKTVMSSNVVPISSSVPSSTQQNRITSTNAHSSNVFYPATASFSPRIPLSSNAHEGCNCNDSSPPKLKGYFDNYVKPQEANTLFYTDEDLVTVLEEENHGKILQAN